MSLLLEKYQSRPLQNNSPCQKKIIIKKIILPVRLTPNTAGKKLLRACKFFTVDCWFLFDAEIGECSLWTS